MTTADMLFMYTTPNVFYQQNACPHIAINNVLPNSPPPRKFPFPWAVNNDNP